jgi:hypothetical protein
MMKKILIWIRILLSTTLSCLVVFAYSPAVFAFCGFYVSQADASLFNKASQVVIARDGKRTVLTMANDYQGDVKDFALVVPVPVSVNRRSSIALIPLAPLA